MKLKIRENHMIDFIFPISLYFLFSLCALLVILLATDVYSGIAKEANLNFTSRTTLSYITAKIRNNDASNAIYLDKFEGEDALIIEQEINGETFVTYIYKFEGYLRELFTKKDAQVTLSTGKAIMEVADFHMEDLGNSLFRFTVTDETGVQNSVMVGVKSPYNYREGGES